MVASTSATVHDTARNDTSTAGPRPRRSSEHNRQRHPRGRPWASRSPAAVEVGESTQGGVACCDIADSRRHLRRKSIFMVQVNRRVKRSVTNVDGTLRHASSVGRLHHSRDLGPPGPGGSAGSRAPHDLKREVNGPSATWTFSTPPIQGPPQLARRAAASARKEETGRRRASTGSPDGPTPNSCHGSRETSATPSNYATSPPQTRLLGRTPAPRQTSRPNAQSRYTPAPRGIQGLAPETAPKPPTPPARGPAVGHPNGEDAALASSGTELAATKPTTSRRHGSTPARHRFH